MVLRESKQYKPHSYFLENLGFFIGLTLHQLHSYNYMVAFSFKSECPVNFLNGFKKILADSPNT